MANPEANLVPSPIINARSVGKIAFTCPNCGQEFPFHRADWRHGHIHCQRCAASYQIGLGFNNARFHDAYLMGKWQHEYCNRWKPIGTGYEGAKVRGPIEWQCRYCQHPQKGLLGYDGAIKCENCPADFFVSLLIYRTSRAGPRKLKVPLDFIVKGLNEVKNVQSVPAKAPSEGTGTPSEGVGENR